MNKLILRMEGTQDVILPIAYQDNNYIFIMMLKHPYMVFKDDVEPTNEPNIYSAPATAIQHVHRKDIKYA